jgi:hypothetical protein
MPPQLLATLKASTGRIAMLLDCKFKGGHHCHFNGCSMISCTLRSLRPITCWNAMVRCSALSSMRAAVVIGRMRAFAMDIRKSGSAAESRNTGLNGPIVVMAARNASNAARASPPATS